MAKSWIVITKSLSYPSFLSQKSLLNLFILRLVVQDGLIQLFDLASLLFNDALKLVHQINLEIGF